MARDWAKNFYKSKAWLDCRAAYIAERIILDGGLCEKCNSSQGYIVHHKILLTRNNINDLSVSLNHNHLEYVCKKCHDNEEGHFNKIIKKSKVTFEGYSFDENGQLVCSTPPTMKV